MYVGFFFENGNPPPGRARPEALTFGTILLLDFHSLGKGVPILRFFLGFGIFTFLGAPILFLCAGPRSLVTCLQLLPLFMLWIPPIPRDNVWLNLLACLLKNKFL